jgi:hypothetical protein
VAPDSFDAFFAASAGVAGALIGLLFVAISVAPEPVAGESRLEMDVRAGVAFSALTDALAVSLFALIPGVQLGVVAFAVACAGLATCLGLGIVLARARTAENRLRQLYLLAGQALVFVFQLIAGIQLAGDPHQVGHVRSLAVLTVVFFLVGIARAWQLIGARETGLFHVVGTALRERSAVDSADQGREPVTPAVEGDPADGATRT